MTPNQRERIAAAFWDRAGGRPAPPRNLAIAAAKVCPVWVRTADEVTSLRVREWFANRGLTLPPSTGNLRPLLGCIIAHRGSAGIFVDAKLPEAEQRVIIAHELGHFVAEYLVPRERVIRRLGQSVLPVLDGDRPPTFAEEAAGWLAGVRVGLSVHVLDRGFDPDSHDRSEQTASELGLELLAGREEVQALATNESGIFDALTGRFGLPASWAKGYAKRLAADARRRVPLSRHWGI